MPHASNTQLRRVGHAKRVAAEGRLAPKGGTRHNSFEIGDGGETEFLYQRTRVKPEENLMLLWPASYTHAHRGNPVLADKYKYIITGWFYYD